MGCVVGVVGLNYVGGFAWMRRVVLVLGSVVKLGWVRWVELGWVCGLCYVVWWWVGLGWIGRLDWCG